jgi:hypothetical protein
MDVPELTVKRALLMFWSTLYEELDSCNVDGLTLEEAERWEDRRYLIPILGVVSFDRKTVVRQTKRRLAGQKEFVRARAYRKMKRTNKDIFGG